MELCNHKKKKENYTKLNKNLIYIVFSNFDNIFYKIENVKNKALHQYYLSHKKVVLYHFLKNSQNLKFQTFKFEDMVSCILNIEEVCKNCYLLGFLDGSIRAFDISNFKAIRLYREHRYKVTSIVSMNNYKSAYFASSSLGGELIIWDFNTNYPIFSFTAQINIFKIFCPFKFNKDLLIFSGQSDDIGLLYLNSLTDNQLKIDYIPVIEETNTEYDDYDEESQYSQNSINEIEQIPIDPYNLILLATKNIYLVDLQTNTKIHEFITDYKYNINTIKFFNQCEFLITTEKQCFLIYKLKYNLKEFEKHEYSKNIFKITAVAEENIFFMFWQDMKGKNKLTIYNLANFQEIETMSLNYNVSQLSFTHDYKILFSIGNKSKEIFTLKID
jgi:WD40 repeat protein